MILAALIALYFTGLLLVLWRDPSHLHPKHRTNNERNEP